MTIKVSALRVSLCGEGPREGLEGTESVRRERREIGIIKTGDLWKAFGLLMMLIKASSEVGFQGLQVAVVTLWIVLQSMQVLKLT